MPSTALAPAGDRPAGIADPRLVDVVLAVAMGAVVAVVAAADLEGTGRAGPLAYLFAAGFGALLLARRKAPRLVLALTVLGIFVYYVFQLPPIGIALPAVAALFSAAEQDRTRAAVLAGVVLVSVAAFFRVDEGLPVAYLLSYDLLTDVALVAAAIALGVGVRSRRELRAHEEHLRALTAAAERREAERRLQAERVGIARDLHDTVGHSLAVIAVHSNVAAEAIGRDDGAAARAVEQIRAAASATLQELRGTVKLLRSPTAAPADRSAGGLAGLPDLVRRAQEAGVQVSTELDVEPGRLDAAVEAAAYRVVQESLTNVLRHAGAEHATVALRLQDRTLHVTVADDGGGAVPSPTAVVGPGAGPGSGASTGQGTARGASAGPGARADRSPDTAPDRITDPDAALTAGGRGLAGMAERVGLLGGTLTAGPGEDGGFVVRAALPARLHP